MTKLIMNEKEILQKKEGRKEGSKKGKGRMIEQMGKWVQWTSERIKNGKFRDQNKYESEQQLARSL